MSACCVFVFRSSSGSSSAFAGNSASGPAGHGVGHRDPGADRCHASRMSQVPPARQCILFLDSARRGCCGQLSERAPRYPRFSDRRRSGGRKKIGGVAGVTSTSKKARYSVARTSCSAPGQNPAPSWSRADHAWSQATVCENSKPACVPSGCPRVLPLFYRLKAPSLMILRHHDYFD